jgi:hypothetical protein
MRLLRFASYVQYDHTRHGSFYLSGKDRGTHCTGGWEGLRAGLGTEARVKSFVSAADRTPIAQYVVRHYTDWATPAAIKCCNILKWPIRFMFMLSNCSYY